MLGKVDSAASASPPSKQRALETNVNAQGDREPVLLYGVFKLLNALFCSLGAAMDKLTSPLGEASLKKMEARMHDRFPHWRALHHCPTLRGARLCAGRARPSSVVGPDMSASGFSEFLLVSMERLLPFEQTHPNLALAGATDGDPFVLPQVSYWFAFQFKVLVLSLTRASSWLPTLRRLFAIFIHHLDTLPAAGRCFIYRLVRRTEQGG